MRTISISKREKYKVGVRNATAKTIETNILHQKVKQMICASAENVRKSMHRNREQNHTFALEIARIKIEKRKIRKNELLPNLTASV